MAAVLIRLIPYLSRILRASSFFIKANSRLRAVSILKREHLFDLAKKHIRSKKLTEYLTDELFKYNLKTHKFIFFSEKDLREYILSIDSNAEICKVLETKEVDLYLCKYGDVRNILDINNENILQELTNIAFLDLYTIFLNEYLHSALAQLREKEQDLENYLIYLVDSNQNNNDICDFLTNVDNNFKNDVDNIIDTRKQEDIDNTYCQDCCCTCKKGSCCCSCNLVHYTQSWEDARADLKDKVDYYINQIKERIRHDLIDRNNPNSMINRIFNDLTNKQNNNSFIMLFLTDLATLLFKTKHISKKIELYAVVKVKNVIKEEKKEQLGKKIKWAYEFFKKYRGKKIEREKIKEEFIKEYEDKFKRKCDEHLFYAYLSKIKKNYLTIKTIKVKDKVYYYIL